MLTSNDKRISICVTRVRRKSQFRRRYRVGIAGEYYFARFKPAEIAVLTPRCNTPILACMTKRKSEQIAALRAERMRVGAEIVALRERLVALERRGMSLGSRILHLEMGGRTRMGQPTLSNAIIRQVWEHIARMSWDGRGVPAKELHWALRSEIPDLRPGTLRVYLHRFREKGLLEKRGSAWHRTAMEVRREA